MGSVTSRGKKVAPSCVGEVRVTTAGGGGVHPPQQARGPSNQHKVQEDADGLAGPWRKTSPRRAFTNSRTYRLCPFSGGHTEDETSSSPQLEEAGDGDRGGSCVFTPRKPHTPAGFSQSQPPTQRFPAGGTFLESAATGKEQTSGGYRPSLPMPVILYDGSEEELMDTIEREFS